MRGMSARNSCSTGLNLAFAATLLAVASCAMGAEATAPTGRWRGTSTCTDRVAAPACKDEIVVYEFRTVNAGTVQWQADKVVGGQQLPMGELALHFDSAASCWKAQFDSPRAQVVWCLSVDGTHMTGTATLLPGKQIVRRIDLHQESAHE